MRKEFTFRNYLVYALRYWLVTVIFAVAGLGGGILYGILSDDVETVTYRGNIVIGGIGVFVDDIKDLTDNPSALYGTIKDGAFDVMVKVRDDIYDDFEKEWRELKYNKKLSVTQAREKFYDALGVWTSGDYFYVEFTQEKTDDLANQNVFSERVVRNYIDTAYDKAMKHEPILARGTNTENKIAKTTVKELTATEDMDTGLIANGLVGAAVGLVAGLLIILAVYLADKRITSYGDIASLTGEKLYDVSRGAVTNKVCPRIDCDMTGAKKLLFAGSEDTSRRLAALYAEYANAAGLNTLKIDFTHPGISGSKDTFNEYLEGAPLENCVQSSFGVDELAGGQSWAKALSFTEKMNALSDKYDRIIICAAYRGDGSLGVLARVSDKTAFAVDQSAMRAPDVLGAALEMASPEKVVGTVIENAGKSFVGTNSYIRYNIEEE